MYLIILSVILPILIYLSLSKNRNRSKKILGIYSVRGKWYRLKYYTMLTILYLRKYSSGHKSGKGMGFGVKSIENLEKLQQLSTHDKAFDAVFFHGVGRNDYFFVGGVERRHKAKVNGLVYVVVPEIGLLHSEQLPKTELDADPVALHKMNSFAAQGLSFTPIEAMKVWKISYAGKMWSENETAKCWHEVTFEGKFTSDFPHFTMDTDSDKKALARAIAKETWSKEFFEILEKAHQTHYEQMGSIDGTLIVDGKLHEIHIMGFRDHSFGYKRDWTMLHRYIFHMFYLHNGIRISCGVISQPCTMSQFEIGYILYQSKKIFPIQSCDLQLYQHAEGGEKLPKELAFTFRANNKSFNCRIKYLHNSIHYKGNDYEAKLFERFFSCEVNGMAGNGISEWQYNNVGTYTSTK